MVELSKVDVAQRVLDQRSASKDCSLRTTEGLLQELHVSIKNVFESAPGGGLIKGLSAFGAQELMIVNTPLPYGAWG